jgi:hypothetical protein
MGKEGRGRISNGRKDLGPLSTLGFGMLNVVTESHRASRNYLNPLPTNGESYPTLYLTRLAEVQPYVLRRTVGIEIGSGLISLPLPCGLPIIILQSPQSSVILYYCTQDMTNSLTHSERRLVFHHLECGDLLKRNCRSRQQKQRCLKEDLVPFWSVEGGGCFLNFLFLLATAVSFDEITW